MVDSLNTNNLILIDAKQRKKLVPQMFLTLNTYIEEFLILTDVSKYVPCKFKDK